jgi:hypothetical protein
MPEEQGKDNLTERFDQMLDVGKTLDVDKMLTEGMFFHSHLPFWVFDSEMLNLRTSFEASSYHL